MYYVYSVIASIGVGSRLPTFLNLLLFKFAIAIEIHMVGDIVRTRREFKTEIIEEKLNYP